MSGHSKWSTIKRQKGAADAKRGQLFTKLSNNITLAVKQGGGIGDPSLNMKLRLAVETARAANMPKDNIERAISRASGSLADQMHEVIYEGFGPGGFSIIVEAITDNKLRTNSEIKNIIEKNGGSFGSPGSVSYQFVSKGLITIPKNNMQLDDIIMLAAESGADDVEEGDDFFNIYTKVDSLGLVRDFIAEKSISIEDASLARIPISTMVLSGEEVIERAVKFVTLLDEHQDVKDVYTNFVIEGAK